MFDLSQLDPGDQDQIAGFEPQIYAALERARDAVQGRGAGSEMGRWFGASDAATCTQVRDGLARMRSFTMHHTVKLAMRADRPADENALATGVLGGLGAKGAGGLAMNSFQRVSGAERDWGGIGELGLGPSFSHLPIYGSVPLSAFDGQDKFETIVHELSHLVLGTGDHGYGAAAARQLARQSGDTAFKNAENWGFFVEEFR